MSLEGNDMQSDDAVDHYWSETVPKSTAKKKTRKPKTRPALRYVERSRSILASKVRWL